MNQESEPASSNPLLAPLIVGCALFMEMLDSTVIATALPAIARSLHQDPIRLNLAITVYMLSLAVFVPISGWMADRYGARSVFRAAIVIFTLGSILCGISGSLSQIVAARILQGFGGAMMVPVGRLIVLRTVPKADLITAMSYLTVPAVLGPVVGPPLGGFIVTYWSWRWIFFINVPIGLIGITLVSRFIANVRECEVPPFDMAGFMLTGIALAGLIFGFETVGRGVLPVWVTLGAIAMGGVCAATYVRHARRTPNPIVDISLMRIPTFAVSTLGGGLFRIGIGALPFLLPMMFQLVFGLTPFASGMLTFTSACGALLMKPTAGPIIRRLGFRTVLTGNGAICAIILASYALFRQSTPHTIIISTLFIGGFLRSLQFTSLNSIAYADVEQSMMSSASTLTSMAQQFFLSLGVTVAAMILHLSLWIDGSKTLTVHDFTPAFLITGALALLSAFSYTVLEHHAGAEVSGRHAMVIDPDEDAKAIPAD
ncbi:MAG TPA: DHA2 family efflux MFS transporter permease subunit [Candidatus Binataceae bacterium]|nr:DHA2 family efflux MFS transporter permease subunit [Candidatus Binataceae bacterium]